MQAQVRRRRADHLRARIQLLREPKHVRRQRPLLFCVLRRPDARRRAAGRLRRRAHRVPPVLADAAHKQLEEGPERAAAGAADGVRRQQAAALRQLRDAQRPGVRRAVLLCVPVRREPLDRGRAPRGDARLCLPAAASGADTVPHRPRRGRAARGSARVAEPRRGADDVADGRRVGGVARRRDGLARRRHVGRDRARDHRRLPKHVSV